MNLPRLTDLGDSPAVLAAESAVRAWCGWHLAPSIEQTINVDQPGPVLFLPTLALTDVSAISRGVDPLTVGSWAFQRNGVVSFLWPLRPLLTDPGPIRLTMTITHGFDETPAEIVEVVRTLADAGAYAIDRWEQSALGPYRLPRIG